jgi:DNA invertase Pin-like site-specific DNA recombinase
MTKSCKKLGAATAIMYTRTSSASNIGDDKDSKPRQEERIHAYAKAKGLMIKKSFDDPAVSGTDPLVCRPGFAQAVQFCQAQHIKTILVESGDRFARDLVVQETGLQWLGELDICIVCVDNATQFSNAGPTTRLVRQMLGSIYEFIGAQIRERLHHSRAEALTKVQRDPHGGPANFWSKDPKLYKLIKQISKRRSVNYTHVATELQLKNPRSWCVRSGPRKGHAWSAKQVRTMLRRFEDGVDRKDGVASTKTSTAAMKKRGRHNKES